MKRPILSAGLVSLMWIFQGIASADSSSPLLAAYYDRFMAVCNGQAYEWEEEDAPEFAVSRVRQVGVGRDASYALRTDGELIGWRDDPEKSRSIMDDVRSFSAGRTGVFIIRNDNSLWHIGAESLLGIGEGLGSRAEPVAEDVLTAAIGDGTNYYVTREGRLFARGKAHRGQYGNGTLKSTDTFVPTADNVKQIRAHTGHAIHLKNNGEVWGTGGNIYGPVGVHGYGDKAVAWSFILGGAIGIATGASHTVAILEDDSLWIWGRNEGLTPKRILGAVDAVAASSDSTIALSEGWLWQWNTGEQPRKRIPCP